MLWLPPSWDWHIKLLIAFFSMQYFSMSIYGYSNVKIDWLQKNAVMKGDPPARTLMPLGGLSAGRRQTLLLDILRTVESVLDARYLCAATGSQSYEIIPIVHPLP
jgi:hypothetical protein